MKGYMQVVVITLAIGIGLKVAFGTEGNFISANLILKHSPP